MDLDQLRTANITRQAEWPGSTEADLAFRALEVSGEGGEMLAETHRLLQTSLRALALSSKLGAVIEQTKKVLREERGIAGTTADRDALGDEIADTIIALDLLAIELGISLSEVIPRKFNRTSQKYGLKTRL